MPVVFILIMSLALQNQFSEQSSVSIDYFLLSSGSDEGAGAFLQRLRGIDNFNQLHSSDGQRQLVARVARDEAKFLLVIAEDFSDRLADGHKVLDLYIAPASEPALVMLFESRLRDLLGRMYLQMAQHMLLDDEDEVALIDDEEIDNLLHSHPLYGLEGKRQIPSSVQQNVPAWLLFAMFFIATPLSTTLIQERQQRTLDRLATMGFSPGLLLLGKLLPYLLINLLQVVLMLLVGIYLVPLLGGDRLELGSSGGALAVVALAASLAAVCYGLLVAQIANTTEQATIFSGVCNIIMAALGGVMVPRFIMPPLMQELTQLSPMAWGLDGFLEVLLRNGTVWDVLPQVSVLLGFALVMLLSAGLLARRRMYR
jgi:ABC-2 type transport system permease protein